MKQLLLTFALLAVQLASAQTTDYDTNRGFIHPGGLHTQADFDRVKAQLEAGNPTVKEAYRVLTSAAYSQSGVQTYPVEVIVRGGGSGENYMNACRGAAMAYQNALRWKIAGTKANANAAVRILMAWANTTKDISGDSNYALASGLYGYQFAQAAELMRDYEGWEREDFELFKRWMLQVWYPKALGFLRGRNGTWENQGKWWQAPGHYWSNWGLCNALCVAMIGILFDDVFIYNQAMSYFKYDQCGTFRENRTDIPIKNDGLTEFLGNLVVTMVNSDLETGAYGYLGQMNESGRDTGHSAMALGLAVDLAKVGWNQGDDLFAYMNHRLAAGIEYVAAQTQSVANLPWTNYQYGSSGYYYSDSRAYVMEGPALGAQNRPYWGTVIGIYEGVKGVPMPFSEKAYQSMGIDGGGLGSTSGGYDHLGYSVLMNTRDVQLCPADQVPTELTPKMEYSGSVSSSLIPSVGQERTRKLVDGQTIYHNELGGLVNTFQINNNTTVPKGQTLKLMPQLPEGEEDTGRWTWNTGETTRDITVSTDRSYIYRVTYTNKNGIESQQAFPIAVAGDCVPDVLTPRITYADKTTEATKVDVLYGKSVTLAAIPSVGWGTYKWSTGATTESITRSITADTKLTVDFKSQGGAVSSQAFDIRMIAAEPWATVGSSTVTKVDSIEGLPTVQVIGTEGGTVVLGLNLPTAVKPADVAWSNGATGSTITLEGLQSSGLYTATFTLRDVEYTFRFDVLVRPAGASYIEPGPYLIRHIDSDTYLTAHEQNSYATFEPRSEGEEAQVWFVERSEVPKYRFLSTAMTDSLHLSSIAKMSTTSNYPFTIIQALGTDLVAIHTGTSSSPRFWDVVSDGSIATDAARVLAAFPFQLLPTESTGVREIIATTPNVGNAAIYDLTGRKFPSLQNKAAGKSSALPHSSTPHLKNGLYIVGGRKVVVK